MPGVYRVVLLRVGATVVDEGDLKALCTRAIAGDEEQIVPLMEGRIRLTAHLRPRLGDLLDPSGIRDIGARDDRRPCVGGAELGWLTIGIGYGIVLRAIHAMPDSTIELVGEE